MTKRTRVRSDHTASRTSTSKSSAKNGKATTVHRHGDVPKPIRQATARFIKKYRTTLRDLENF